MLTADQRQMIQNLKRLSQNAKGADTHAGDWAKYRGLTVIRVPALWDLHGKSAGMIRNKEMLGLQPDVIIAFKGGAGTENMITISRKAGVPVFIA